MTAGWDACTQDPHEWMRFIECHPGFASYLQAAGIILTVAGALFGPSVKTAYDRWFEQRQLRRDADDVARGLKVYVEQILERLNERLEVAAVPGELQPAFFVARMGIEIPGQLDVSLMMDNDSYYRERLRFIYDLLVSLREFNMGLQPFRELRPPFDQAALGEMRAVVTQRLTSLKERATDVRHSIYALG